MDEELRVGATPYEEHVFSLLRVVRAAVSPPPSAEAATYDVALAHASKVKTALSANPAAWAAWLEACLDANMAHETCTLRIAHLLGAQHAPLLVDLARLRPGVLGTIEAQLRSELGAATDAAQSGEVYLGAAAAGLLRLGDADGRESADAHPEPLQVADPHARGRAAPLCARRGETPR